MQALKIGLLGGTFDPIHIGHLNLAFEVLEKKGLDQIWFIPAHINPHKGDVPPTTAEHRLTMIQLAIQGIPQFVVNTCEMSRAAPSYSIDTIKNLIVEYSVEAPLHQFYLIMGEDAAARFYQWHQAEEIIKLLPLLIGSRSTTAFKKINFENTAILNAINEGFISTRLMDISSTDIRFRFSKGLYVAHFLSPAVMQYIHDHRLYK